jgi:hypothetical protein
VFALLLVVNNGDKMLKDISVYARRYKFVLKSAKRDFSNLNLKNNQLPIIPDN